MVDQSIKYEKIERLYNMCDEERLDELGGYVGGERGGHMRGVSSILLSDKVHESKLERGNVEELYRHYLGIMLNHQAMECRFNNVMDMIEIKEYEGHHGESIFESLNNDKDKIVQRYVNNLRFAEEVLKRIDEIDPSVIDQYITN